MSRSTDTTNWLSFAGYLVTCLLAGLLLSPYVEESTDLLWFVPTGVVISFVLYVVWNATWSMNR